MVYPQPTTVPFLPSRPPTMSSTCRAARYSGLEMGRQIIRTDSSTILAGRGSLTRAISFRMERLPSLHTAS